MADFCDLATISPKLYGGVAEAIGVFYRDVVIGTYQIDCSDDGPVGFNNIGSIICHCGTPLVPALIKGAYFY